MKTKKEMLDEVRIIKERMVSAVQENDASELLDLVDEFTNMLKQDIIIETLNYCWK